MVYVENYIICQLVLLEMYFLFVFFIQLLVFVLIKYCIVNLKCKVSVVYVFIIIVYIENVVERVCMFYYVMQLVCIFYNEFIDMD